MRTLIISLSATLFLIFIICEGALRFVIHPSVLDYNLDPVSFFGLRPDVKIPTKFEEGKVYSETALYHPHPSLNHKPNPKHHDHDENGWRNLQVYPTPDIVAIGDSQTYGANAKKEESWPTVLDGLIDQKVYQTAFGGYGPAHYLILVKKALKQNVKNIIVGLYLGNDIYDSYVQVYNKNDNFQWIEPTPEVVALRSQDTEYLERLNKVDKIDPNFFRYSFFHCDYKPYIKNRSLLKIEDIEKLPPLTTARYLPWHFEWLRPLKDFSVFFEALYKLKSRKLIEEYQRANSWEAKDWDLPFCIPFNKGKIKTIFTPGYRLISLEPTDPRVPEGVRLAKGAINKMASMAKEKGANIHFVIIPTKEKIFHGFIKGDPSLSSEDYHYFNRLVEQETLVTQQLEETIKSNNLTPINIEPWFVSALREGNNPYSENTNGHPNNVGYKIIGEKLAEYFNKGKAQ